MLRRLFRAWLTTLLAAVPVALIFQPPASGQEPALDVYYTKLEPKEQFRYKWKGKEGIVNAGVFRWEVPQTSFGTNGLDRNFTGYCAEILVPITAEKLYSFRVNSLFDPTNYDGVAGHEDAPLVAQKRVVYIQELFGRYFHDPVLKAVDPVDAVALQVALWEVVQESEPPEGQPLKLDLFNGAFQANYPRAEAPAYVLRAQEYLNSLTANDALFYDNPELRGRELIRLQGIPNAQGVVAQSQFALRFDGGAGAGAGGASSALLGGGGLGGLGGSGPGLGGGGVGPGPGSGTGLAPFLGGGSGLGGSAPGSGITTPPGSGITTPTVTPHLTTPPVDGPPSTPPVNGPPSQTPPVTTPVPAPTGVLLGVIALGTIGSWRLGFRLLARK